MPSEPKQVPPVPPPPGPLGDLWGALAAAVVALPASLAFGVLVYSALGPEHAAAGATVGALGTVALGLVAPLVGRNGGLVTAPCAPAAAVLSGLVVTLAADGAPPASYVIASLAVVALFAGLLQIVYGALKLGRIIKYIPYQVVAGYLSGIALIIALGQLPKLLGLGKQTGLLDGLFHPALWRWPGVLVGALTIAAGALAPRVTKKVPPAVVGFAVGLAGYFLLALARPELLQLDGNPLLIGRVGEGSILTVVGDHLSALAAFRPTNLHPLLAAAATLSVLLSIDTLKTGVVLDALTRGRMNSNRELVAQGAGNLASALVGGMPGSGTMGPTLVNVTSGGHSPWSGLGVGALSLAAFLGLRSAIAWVPISVLAGILLVVSFKMFDWHAFALLKHRETRLDFAVMAAVVVVAQTVGLIEAALVGVALAILLFIRDQVLGSAILRAHDLRSVGSQRRRLAAARKLLDEHGQAGQLVELQGNLFFGTTDRLYSDLADTLAFRRYLLFDLRRVQSLDYTAAHLFQQMHARLQEQGGRILLSGMPSNAPTHRDIERYLAKLGLVHSGEGIPIFESRNDALEWMEDRVLGEAGWKEPEDDRPLELSEIELFRELGPEDIAALAKIAEPVHLAAGAKLFSRGDPGDELHLIRRGVVDVQLPLPGGKRHHLATIGRGDYLGEMAFLDKGTRSADAQARGEADLFSVHRARFNEFAREHPSVASKIFARLALLVSLRLRSADAELRVLEER